MALKFPSSVEECVYFTRRLIKDGKVVAWVFKELCPKCKKSLMGKPKEKGKVKIRAKKYVCESCSYTLPKEEYKNTLTTNVQYTCPHCKHEGEIQVPFKRRKMQVFDEEEQKKITAEVVRFQCQKCGQNIDITKKMK